MCGRMTLTTTEGIVDELGVAAPALLQPRYNIAPSQPLLVVANRRERILEEMRWGLVPSWAENPKVGSKMINARRESLVGKRSGPDRRAREGEPGGGKPAFRDAYTRRRCLVLADGFYEWKRDGRRSSPFYYHRRDRRPFTFAGLWERWKQPDGQWLLSCAVITTDPNRLVEPIHDRMPVIVAPDDYARWLSPDPVPPGALDDLLEPPPPAPYEVYPVSPLVNSPDNDSPQLINRAEPIQGSLF